MLCRQVWSPCVKHVRCRLRPDVQYSKYPLTSPETLLSSQQHRVWVTWVMVLRTEQGEITRESVLNLAVVLKSTLRFYFPCLVQNFHFPVRFYYYFFRLSLKFFELLFQKLTVLAVPPAGLWVLNSQCSDLQHLCYCTFAITSIPDMMIYEEESIYTISLWLSQPKPPTA